MIGSLLFSNLVWNDALLSLTTKRRGQTLPICKIHGSMILHKCFYGTFESKEALRVHKKFVRVRLLDGFVVYMHCGIAYVRYFPLMFLVLQFASLKSTIKYSLIDWCYFQTIQYCKFVLWWKLKKHLQRNSETLWSFRFIEQTGSWTNN